MAASDSSRTLHQARKTTKESFSRANCSLNRLDLNEVSSGNPRGLFKMVRLHYMDDFDVFSPPSHIFQSTECCLRLT